MSEFIDNANESDRVKQLFDFTKRVRNGEPIETVREEYNDAIEAVTPHDVLVIEHTALESGTPIPTIKEEIEPILETFRPGLETTDWDQPHEGHPVDNLMAENEEIAEHLDIIAETRAELSDTDGPPLEAIGTLQESVRTLDAGVDLHFLTKENVLFPHLESHLKYDRPLGVMWSLHDDIRSTLGVLDTMLSEPEANFDTVQTLFDRLDELLEGMRFKEERIIYPVATEMLEDAEWVEVQSNSAEIGYFGIDPPLPLLTDDPQSGDGVPADTQLPTPEGDLAPREVLLGLETGTLSLEQIELLFDTLPVDVTFVDENDTVRYFNNPADRIFPRSGSIVGRSVQNCHPPESVDRVEAILSAFRSGEEDRARFWIQNDGSFVVIDYYAMRGENGEYRGTLEVSHEVSDIRELEGEKRLLDWEE
ncbi:MAG: DUF438 domain-containing protein [Halodesulfurarchaeum sp.]